MAEFGFDVKCDECSDILDAEFNSGVLFVPLCEKCLEGAKDEGYKEGKRDRMTQRRV